ncbi:MAG: vWA domain-containing protein [Myxococcota bacterium]
MRRFVRATGLLAAASLLLGGAAAEGRGWLAVRAPLDGELLSGPVPFVQVSGRAGPDRGGQDVVIALDVSGSTLDPSGIDIDGDGRLGSMLQPLPLALLLGPTEPWHRFWDEGPVFDAGDTVRAAEVAAARRLLAQLDLGLTRVGIVSFAASARLEAPLGSGPEALRRALDGVALSPTARGGGTDFGAAIDSALSALAKVPPRPGGGESQFSILFLSDGRPTRPGRGLQPGLRTLEAADRAGQRAVAIHAFAIGPDALRHEHVYAEMAARSGGELTRVEDPGRIVTELPRIQLGDLAGIAMENVTMGAPGRAVRTFPDGSFDGYLPLVPGANRLRVTARSRSGGAVSLERTVDYRAGEPTTPDGARQWSDELERFTRTLRERTTELREFRRGAYEKKVEVRGERRPAVAAEGSRP